ncbi:uncharacterized protein BDZ99DRAFT_394327 [Mytilinidion resinicola]|uniref:Rhodopsin domain-containing protein n=1 Tax=Mytilinidion resinicola TaxID=574789 RepID=A0A6A6YCH4_9PEZI|nr:uncharacterized protein BDZ99DRAFT_394327 [Mytilinidion resinicola]KAF2806512.1 hypothetical protein BDZ99DRAFT_394327 [Mytilinidion resinicola]
MATPPLPNYPNDNQGPIILATTGTVTALALITLALRLFVRIRMIRNVGWDDYAMIMAAALCIAGFICIVPEVHNGAGQHINHVDRAHFGRGLKWNFVTQPIYLWSICLVKISIGFFLLRVAATTFFRRLIISIMVFMMVYTLVCFFTIVLQCTHLSVLWDSTVKSKCFAPTTLRALSYTNVSLNILTDFMFSIFIPIPMLWHVQMNFRTKSSIVGILALGIFATAAALVKTSYLPNYGRHGDWLWDSRNLTIWTVMESCVGIVAGNLPCMKPLFKRVLGSTYGRGSAKRSSNLQYYRGGYGGATGHSAKNYNSLESRTTKEGVAVGVDANGDNDAIMMTRITARSKSANSVDSQSNISDDSITRLEGGRFGITKTTTTKVAFTKKSESKDEVAPERKETHLV